MVYSLISGSPATPRFSIPHSLDPRSILKKPAKQSKIIKTAITSQILYKLVYSVYSRPTAGHMFYLCYFFVSFQFSEPANGQLVSILETVGVWHNFNILRFWLVASSRYFLGDETRIKLSYRWAWCVRSVEILQQCRNYLCDKSWTNRCHEVGGNV